MKRAVGYCENHKCQEFAKGVFLLNHNVRFDCTRCGEWGLIEEERYRDDAADDDDAVYKSVRVHFNFRPLDGQYSQIAIVDVNELRYGATYEIFSPMVKTEQRALKIAETVLCQINSGMKLVDGRATYGTVLNTSMPDWPGQIQRLEEMLAERARRVEHALR